MKLFSSLKSLLVLGLLSFSPVAHGVLRGDETAQLTRTRDLLREKMSNLEAGSEKHDVVKMEFQKVSHKLRALELLEQGMTQEEYDSFAELVERQHELKVRHEQREQFSDTERKEFANVNREVKEILKKYKGKRKGREQMPQEDLDKVVELRQKLKETTDRDEMESVRNELQAIYDKRPQLTKLGRQKFKQRKQDARAKERKRKGAKSKFPEMDEARLARVKELRQQIHETEDRDELVRLRQALKFERDQAAHEEKDARANNKAKGRKRKQDEKLRDMQRKRPSVSNEEAGEMREKERQQGESQ